MFALKVGGLDIDEKKEILETFNNHEAIQRAVQGGNRMTRYEYHELVKDRDSGAVKVRRLEGLDREISDGSVVMFDVCIRLKRSAKNNTLTQGVSVKHVVRVTDSRKQTDVSSLSRIGMSVQSMFGATDAPSNE
jgi:hypothetical protein